MKPRLRLSRGYWFCGIPGFHLMYWTCGTTPAAAFALWKYSQHLKARHP